MLETSEYYNFGLKMSGISYSCVGKIQNRDKTFQGQKFDDDLGANYVQFKWRNHDPQIGRFIEIDPLAEKYVYNSTYAFSENKATSFIELEGLEASPLPYFIRAIENEFRNTASSIDNAITPTATNTVTTENSSKKIGSLTIANSTEVKQVSTYGYNFLGIMDYIIRNNSNEGNPEPLTKTNNTVTVSNVQKTELKIKGATITNKTKLNIETGEVTGENSVKVNRKGTDISGGLEMTSDGKVKVKAEVSGENKSGSTKVKGTASISSNGNTSNFEIGGSVEKKSGKTTVEKGASIIINF